MRRGGQFTYIPTGGGDESSRHDDFVFVRQAQLFQRELIKCGGERHFFLTSDGVGRGAEPRVDAALKVEARVASEMGWLMSRRASAVIFMFFS